MNFYNFYILQDLYHKSVIPGLMTTSVPAVQESAPAPRLTEPASPTVNLVTPPVQPESPETPVPPQDGKLENISESYIWSLLAINYIE